MMNKLLHILTNRSGDFENEFFNSTKWDTFPQAAYQDISDLMGFGGPDYYVIHHLMNFLSHPEIVIESSGVEVYPPFTVPAYSVLNGKLETNDSGDIGVRLNKDKFPVGFQVEIEWISEGRLSISYAGESETIRFSRGVGNPDVSWPDWFQVTGNLKPDDLENKPVVFLVWPEFPWAALAKELDKSSSVQDLIRSMDWNDRYHHADSKEKSALVCGALLKWRR